MQTSLNRLLSYLNTLQRVASAPSPMGMQLEGLRDGTLHARSGRLDGMESRLVDLCDKFPDIPNVTSEDLKVLAVYSATNYVRFMDLDANGVVVDQWLSGPNHSQAAKALGYSGRNRARQARNALKKALKNLNKRAKL